MPKISVISAYYNRRDVVARTIESIAAQTCDDYVAVFVDDGSRDDTFARMSPFASDRIKVKRTANQGLTQTFVSAIAETQSEYIAIQGSGDASHPERLARQAAYLDENPKVGAVGCYGEIILDAAGKSAIRRVDFKTDPVYQLRRENPFMHGDVMMRRSVYEAAGGYRPVFKYRQDLDLWLRMAERSSLHVLPQVLYRAYKLPESVSEDPAKLRVAFACRDFAVHCSREREAGRPDPLERDGPIALMNRPRSRALARDYLFEARRRAERGDMQAARMFARASLEEMPMMMARVTQATLRHPALHNAYASLAALKRSVMARRLKPA